MNKIPSFSKNHDVLPVGLHLSTEALGITTWDLRFKKPNGGDYVSPKALHSAEHMLATTLRNGSVREKVVYFGPMGCRTGFYLLTAGLDYGEVLNALKEACRAALELDEIPGNKREECGNYLEHDFDDARREISAYLAVLESL